MRITTGSHLKRSPGGGNGPPFVRLTGRGSLDILDVVVLAFLLLPFFVV